MHPSFVFGKLFVPQSLEFFHLNKNVSLSLYIIFKLNTIVLILLLNQLRLFKYARECSKSLHSYDTLLCVSGGCRASDWIRLIAVSVICLK